MVNIENGCAVWVSGGTGEIGRLSGRGHDGLPGVSCVVSILAGGT